MIEGVRLTDLKIIADHRGSVRHMLREDEPHFQRFGEVYASTVLPSVVKAWHLHKEMTLNYICLVGNVIVGLLDLRYKSPTFQKTMAIELHSEGPNYRLLTIPPWVWNGFRIPTRSTCDFAMIVNCATLPHRPDELERRPPDEFQQWFDWGPYEIGG